MSQPNDVDREVDDRRPLPSYAWYLVAMCVSVTALLVLLLADLSGQIEFPRGLYSVLAATFAFTGAGYLVRSAENRVLRRVERSPGTDATYWKVYTDVMNDLGGVSADRRDG